MVSVGSFGFQATSDNYDSKSTRKTALYGKNRLLTLLVYGTLVGGKNKLRLYPAFQEQLLLSLLRQSTAIYIMLQSPGPGMKIKLTERFVNAFKAKSNDPESHSN